jgi:hypothetical protein
MNLIRPLALAFVIVGQVIAGGAAFSPDGRTVYLNASDQPGELEVLHLSDERSQQLTFHRFQQASHPKEIKSIASAANGRLLLLDSEALWTWTPASDDLQRLRNCPAGMKFNGIACHPKSGRILITVFLDKPEDSDHDTRLLFADTPEAPLLTVRVRRLDRICCPVFLSDGSILFGAEGDLWQGTVDVQNENGEAPRPVLSATRYAPLADRETYDGTPMQTGVHDIAVSAHKVYVHVSRMGGSGWGDVLRLNLPGTDTEKKGDKDTGILRRYKEYREALASAEWLEENPSCAFLCNSADGKQVIFTNGCGPNRRHYLVTDDGDHEPLSVKRH